MIKNRALVWGIALILTSVATFHLYGMRAKPGQQEGQRINQIKRSLQNEGLDALPPVNEVNALIANPHVHASIKHQLETAIDNACNRFVADGRDITTEPAGLQAKVADYAAHGNAAIKAIIATVTGGAPGGGGGPHIPVHLGLKGIPGNTIWGHQLRAKTAKKAIEALIATFDAAKKTALNADITNAKAHFPNYLPYSSDAKMQALINAIIAAKADGNTLRGDLETVANDLEADLLALNNASTAYVPAAHVPAHLGVKGTPGDTIWGHQLRAKTAKKAIEALIATFDAAKKTALNADITNTKAHFPNYLPYSSDAKMQALINAIIAAKADGNTLRGDLETVANDLEADLVTLEAASTAYVPAAHVPAHLGVKGTAGDTIWGHQLRAKTAKKAIEALIATFDAAKKTALNADITNAKAHFPNYLPYSSDAKMQALINAIIAAKGDGDALRGDLETLANQLEVDLVTLQTASTAYVPAGGGVSTQLDAATKATLEGIHVGIGGFDLQLFTVKEDATKDLAGHINSIKTPTPKAIRDAFIAEVKAANPGLKPGPLGAKKTEAKTAMKNTAKTGIEAAGYPKAIEDDLIAAANTIIDGL